MTLFLSSDLMDILGCDIGNDTLRELATELELRVYICKLIRTGK
jgi:hypothetical protein